MSQVDEVVARKIYRDYQFDDLGLRTSEIRGKNLEQIANVLSARIVAMAGQIGAINAAEWTADFLSKCREAREQEILVWEARWQEVCDGKRLFSDLVRRVGFKISLPKFKKRVMLGIRSVPTANWRAIESLLKGLIEV